MDCIKCGKEISKLRLEVLPNTKWCVNCSEEKERDDSDIICAQPSVECRNGFGKSD